MKVLAWEVADGKVWLKLQRS
ncbi:hypothetical protein [Nostoc sp.]